MSVEVRNAGFSYGEGEVLRGVSFSAGPGDLVAVLGPNGVGKSTLFGCLLGVLHPQKGVVLLNGHDAAKLSGAEIAGGAILILLGVKILLEHLGVISF